jgi:hypothetical protein
MKMPGQITVTSAGSLPNSAKIITMGEDSPGLTEIVGRKQFLDTTYWTTTHSRGSIIASYNVPFSLISSKAMRPAFENSIYWRGTARVTMQLQSTTFVAGSLIVVWAPLLDAVQAAQVYAGRLSSAHIARHMFLYPGNNPSIDFEIPFTFPQSHLDIRQQDRTLGTLLVMVRNRLRTGENSPSDQIALTSYGSFIDNEFAVLNPKTIVIQGGIQSKVTNYNLEHVMNASIDAGSTQDSFAGGSTDFKVPTMDKPNVCLNPMPALVRQVPNLCNNVGIEYAQNMDLPAASLPVVLPIVTSLARDEMSLEMMFKTPCYAGVFQILASNNPNDVLYTGDLCPGSEFFVAETGASIDLSLFSFAALPFSYWKGGISVELEVVCSIYHTCKLAICSHYGYEAAGLTVDEAMGQYTTIFEVAGGTSRIRVDFPWRCPSEFKEVCNGSYVDATPFSMGQFSVRLLSPLQYNETVSSTIDVNVFISGGPDFQTSFLGSNAIDVAIVD